MKWKEKNSKEFGEKLDMDVSPNTFSENFTVAQDGLRMTSFGFPAAVIVIQYRPTFWVEIFCYVKMWCATSTLFCELCPTFCQS